MGYDFLFMANVDDCSDHHLDLEYRWIILYYSKQWVCVLIRAQA